ncbi:hypothetical protein [Picosynechococcus sp. PCC 7117]|uniref:hypothetical protein n=1 Tax=Picosynechococcus sp. PCC 7117 TaxID=195498 RepID=UPI0018DCA24D|nr:hypothetical protein [Picosynechococcus sp. PCC 7117]
MINTRDLNSPRRSPTPLMTFTKHNCIINLQKNGDVQNRIKQKSENLLFDELDQYNIKLNFDEIDDILDRYVATAIIRLPDA